MNENRGEIPVTHEGIENIDDKIEKAFKILSQLKEEEKTEEQKLVLLEKLKSLLNQE